MKKPSALVVGQRLRRTLGALLAIGFATTWWKLVPTSESVAAPIDPPPPATLVERVPSHSPVVVIAIPIVIPFALPIAPTPAPTPPKRHRPRIVRPPVVQPPIVAEVPETPPTNDPEPHIRTRSS